MPVEVREASSERVVVLFSECPLGLEGVGGGETCRASMSIDIETVRRL